MTEAQWRKTDDQVQLLMHLRGRASDRKLRLLACAVTRGWWKWMIRKRSQRAVEVAERFADGEATAAELASAHDAAFANEDAWGVRTATERETNVTYALERAVWASQEDAWQAADYVLCVASNREEADLLREIFGNPFRPVRADRWRAAPAVADLARAAYDERLLPSGELDPVRLAVLADALEEAGAGGALLAHLRAPGPHVRGCWAVDLLLGRG
jgi:hypothetical protein